MTTSGTPTSSGFEGSVIRVIATFKTNPLSPYSIGDVMEIHQWFDPSVSKEVPDSEYLVDMNSGVNYPSADWTWNDFKQEPPAFASTTHTITNGTNTPVPAGLKAVIVTALTDGVIVAGQTINTGDSISISATTSNRSDAVLPAIAPVGGTWDWSALDNVEF